MGRVGRTVEVYVLAGPEKWHSNGGVGNSGGRRDALRRTILEGSWKRN